MSPFIRDRFERLGCRLVADPKPEEQAVWTAAGRPHLAVLGDLRAGARQGRAAPRWSQVGIGGVGMRPAHPNTPSALCGALWRPAA
jgi:hypothetical protein